MQAALEAQATFLDAKAAFSAQMSKFSTDLRLDARGTSNNNTVDTSTQNQHSHTSAASKTHAEPSKDGSSAVRLTAESHASSASRAVPHVSPGVSHFSADSGDSPGSIENQPQEGNLRQDRLLRQGSFKGLLGSLSFNRRPGSDAQSGQIRPDMGKLRAKSESGAVLGERRVSNSNTPPSQARGAARMLWPSSTLPGLPAQEPLTRSAARQ